MLTRTLALTFMILQQFMYNAHSAWLYTHIILLIKLLETCRAQSIFTKKKPSCCHDVRPCRVHLFGEMAFDTIDHSILLHRLKTWFGIDGSVLSWNSSYLSSRTFTVSAHGKLSHPTPLAHGVPQDQSSPTPIHSIHHSSRHSHLSTAVDHHLYADDTQLYISFKPSLFSAAEKSLKSTFAAVSNWVTATCLL